jgi:hypothetical protein
MDVELKESESKSSSCKAWTFVSLERMKKWSEGLTSTRRKRTTGPFRRVKRVKNENRSKRQNHNKRLKISDSNN